MKLHNYQLQVGEWLTECFGQQIANDQKERGFRFGEEALELIQALDVTKEEALALVEYVYGRPKGETYQEVGGVMVTLASLCHASGLSLEYCAVAELERIKAPAIMDKIRSKQATKPQRSPLPGTGLNAPTKEGGEQWKEYNGPKRRHYEHPATEAEGIPKGFQSRLKHLDAPRMMIISTPNAESRSFYDLTPSPREPGPWSAWAKDSLDVSMLDPSMHYDFNTAPRKVPYTLQEMTDLCDEISKTMTVAYFENNPVLEALTKIKRADEQRLFEKKVPDCYRPLVDESYASEANLARQNVRQKLYGVTLSTDVERHG